MRSNSLEQRLLTEQEQRQLQRLEQFQQQVRQTAERLNLPYTTVRRIVKGELRLALTDSNPQTRKTLARLLRDAHCIVEEVPVTQNIQEYCRTLIEKSRVWDAFIFNADALDVRVTDFAETLYQQDPDIPVLALTSDYDKFTEIDAYRVQNESLRLRPVYVPQELKVRQDATSLIRLYQNAIRNLKRQFLKIDLEHKIPVMIKFGGSLYDVDEGNLEGRQKADPNILLNTAKLLRQFQKRHPEYALFLTVGGGPVNNNLKNWRDKYGTMLKGDPQVAADWGPGHYPYEQMAKNLHEYQARKLQAILQEAFDKDVLLVNPDNTSSIGAITDETFEEFPGIIFPFAPREYRRYSDSSQTVSIGHSDDQTLLLCIATQTQRCLFLKDAYYGICNKDPNRTDVRDCVQFPEVTAADLLSGKVQYKGPVLKLSGGRIKRVEPAYNNRPRKIRRIGTDNRGGHLIEDSALENWLAAAEAGSTELQRIIPAHPYWPRHPDGGPPREPHIFENTLVHNMLTGFPDMGPGWPYFSSIVLKYGQDEPFPPQRP